MPLTSLCLTGCECVTDAGLGVLKGMQLTLLNIDSNGEGNLTDAGLSVLLDMPLSSLSLTCQGRITGVGLQSLRILPLTALRFGWAQILDSHVEALKGMSLSDLSFRGAPITDESLKHLKDMPLTSLDLSYCEDITGSGLAVFDNSPLEKVETEGCVRLSSEAVARFWEGRAQYWRAEARFWKAEAGEKAKSRKFQVE